MVKKCHPQFIYFAFHALLFLGMGVHVVGELAGKINGLAIEDVRFSVYSDIQSRTTFVSLDSVPASVGWLLRAVMPIATTPGFLFAFSGASVDNGFGLMGSNFLHRTHVTFNTGNKTARFQRLVFCKLMIWV